MRSVNTVRQPRATLQTLKVFKVPEGTATIVEEVVPTPDTVAKPVTTAQ